MESYSATEVQAEIGNRRSTCGTPKQHASEEDIKKILYVLKDVPGKIIRAYFIDRDTATDQYIRGSK
ncbi:hypothetical protein [Streptomyces sp. NPDC091371]|uniref:hypothetical protein n=1 Tax=Streptomyces sp. NPDC091371 TaxID=3155303 RepID=UPI00343D2E9E